MADAYPEYGVPADRPIRASSSAAGMAAARPGSRPSTVGVASRIPTATRTTSQRHHRAMTHGTSARGPGAGAVSRPPWAGARGEHVVRERSTSLDRAGQAAGDLGQPLRALRAEPRPRRRGHRVGGGLDPLPQLTARGREPLLVEQPGVLQGTYGAVPLLLRPPAQRLGRRLGEPPAGGGVRDDRLDAAQAGALQGGDVAVPAVLAQQRDGVEEDQVWRLGPGEVGQAGIQRAARRGRGPRSPRGPGRRPRRRRPTPAPRGRAAAPSPRPPPRSGRPPPRPAWPGPTRGAGAGRPARG